jgi:hypothetical protein
MAHPSPGYMTAPGSYSKPALPTYRTAASFLERKNGSGFALAGWTIARTLLIAPPMLIVGVPATQAWVGAGLSSALISGFTLLRILNTGTTGLAGASCRRRRSLNGARARRRRTR